MEALKSTFTDQEQPEAIYDFDGYRLEFAEWWFNVRPSNTEPFLRLVVEAESNDLLQNRLGQINNVLEPYIEVCP
jgi:phosphomannomutase